MESWWRDKMDDKKNFLEHVNKKNDKVQVSESFEEEHFVKTKKKYFGLVLISIIAILTLLGVYIMTNQKVQMIDLTELSSEEATLWANNNNLILSISEVFSDKDENRIVEQSINKGKKVEKDEIVKVVVSKGLDPYELITIPEFDSTWSRNSIRIWLDEYGIENYIFVDVINDSVEEDFLINYRIIGSTIESFNRTSEIEFTV